MNGHILGAWNCISLQSDTNTFQGILITDGIHSYAVFIYECGGMEWGGGVIGWQSSSTHYEEHYLSGDYYSNDIGCLYSNSYSAIVYRLDCKWECAATNVLTMSWSLTLSLEWAPLIYVCNNILIHACCQYVYICSPISMGIFFSSNPFSCPSAFSLPCVSK